MSDHKEKNKESRRQRGASRRAQLRQQERRIKILQDVVRLQCFETARLVREKDELYKRLCATQELLPFWVRKVP